MAGKTKPDWIEVIAGSPRLMVRRDAVDAVFIGVEKKPSNTPGVHKAPAKATIYLRGGDTLLVNAEVGERLIQNLEAGQ